MAPDLADDPLLRHVPVVMGHKVLEPCVLFACVGRGGMGSVYRGRHLNLGIEVAVKCLVPTVQGEGDGRVARFLHEASLAATVRHHNLVHVYDVCQRHGLYYLIMDMVRGETGRERVVRKGPLPEQEALRLVAGAAHGLAAAHALGIVHRDVKPDNVLVSADGHVKVVDLGLARALMGTDHGPRPTSVVLGTPQYMAPEQWRDPDAVGPPGDVHALAATLWFLLTGRDAVPNGSVPEMAERAIHQPFPDVRALRPDVSRKVVELIASCTHKEPDHRLPDAKVLAMAIEDLLAWDSDSLADPALATALEQRLGGAVPGADVLAGIRRALSAAIVTPPPDGPGSRPGARPRPARRSATTEVVVLPNGLRGPSRPRLRSQRSRYGWPLAAALGVLLAVGGLWPWQMIGPRAAGAVSILTPAVGAAVPAQCEVVVRAPGAESVAVNGAAAVRRMGDLWQVIVDLPPLARELRVEIAGPGSRRQELTRAVRVTDPAVGR